MIVLSKVYINNIYQGETYGTSWIIPFSLLEYNTTYNWRIDTYDSATGFLTTGDTWTFTVKPVPSYFSGDSNRPADYESDKIWGWNSETEEYEWLDNPEIMLSGGGRFNQQIIVFGHNTIYYSGL